MKRVLLADDHAAVRRALRRLIESAGEFEICAEAADGEDAVRQAAIHRPDIVVLDLAMPRLDGLGAARAIRAILPHIAIAIVTMHASDVFASAAEAAGANAYLQKCDVELQLLPAMAALIDQTPRAPGSDRFDFTAPPAA
jgi:DNA-binding NarL/FixJ family response regulator